MLDASFDAAIDCVNAHLGDKNVRHSLHGMIAACVKMYESGGTLYFCGNGGSMADAMHGAEELTGRFKKNREALPAMAISDPAYLTCVGNDYGFESVFSRFIEAHGRPNDGLVVLSTSGNSQNIVHAVHTAQKKGLFVLSFLGKDGGKVKGMSEHEILIHHEDSERIQEVHMTLIHLLVEGIERQLFKHLYP